jgi:hypothetical protein
LSSALLQKATQVVGAIARSIYTVIGVLSVAISAYAQERSSQEDSSRNEPLRVFIDCASCDDNYIRTEVTFVNYVRDRALADVHVLITTQATGGGTQYTLKFIGLERFKGLENSLTYSASQTSTSDERRRGLVAVLKLGLIRYVADSPIASRLKVTFDAPPNPQQSNVVRDPWNFWVFRVGASGEIEAEEQNDERRLSGSFSANRTTDRWKFDLQGTAGYEREQFELDEDDTFTATSRNGEVVGLLVKSLTAHWSAGATAAVGTSTFENYDLRSRVAPGIEFNVFPYRESTRRILTMFYSVGLRTADYSEETIFGKLSERFLDHQLAASIGLRQPWGTASGALELVHYLNRTDKYRLEGFGEIDVRLFKGFSLELFARGSRRRDHLSLRRGSATLEEILVRQRELATGYEYEIGFGFSYSFGSIFNNVVNPRFRNIGSF